MLLHKNIDLFSIIIIVSSICFWPIQISYYGFSLPIIFFLNLIIFLFIINKRVKLQKYQVILIFLIIISFFLSFINPNCNNFSLKSFISSMVFIFIIFTYACYFNSFSFDYKKILIISGNLSLFIIFIFVILEIFFYEYFFSLRRFHSYGRYSGIFTEPSHLAIAIFPGLISIATLMNSSKKYYILVFYVLFFFIFSYSNTLVIYTTIIFSTIYILRYKISFIKLVFFLIFIYFLFQLFINYSFGFNERVSSLLMLINNDYYANLSLSSIIYLRGWYTAFYDLSYFFGIGLGFNDLGCHINYNDSLSYHLKDKGREYFLLNIKDGSFLASKIISEFGLLSLFIFYFLIKNLRNYYLMNLRFKNNLDKMFFLFFVFLLIMLVTRSVAYFGSIWILIYLFLLHKKNLYEEYIDFK